MAPHSLTQRDLFNANGTFMATAYGSLLIFKLATYQVKMKPSRDAIRITQVELYSLRVPAFEIPR